LLDAINLSTTMSSPVRLAGSSTPQPAGAGALFREAPAWSRVARGWQPVFGSFRADGYSIEWHDFQTRQELDWGASFHPQGVELCLNLSGHGFVESGGRRTEFPPNMAGFYYRQDAPLTARRAAAERHQFLTVEFSGPFLARHLSETKPLLHPMVQAAMDGRACPGGQAIHLVGALTTHQLQTVATLRHPPVYAAAQKVWYRCKALELAVAFFLQPEEPLFCTRQQRLAQERVEQVWFLLRQNLAAPPSLEELGRKIGCSPFYLSRIFSAHTGQTIPQALRRLRLEKAAELLRSGEYNVTEAALEVGYSSLSHFSAAFHEAFGCCPGLYPLATATQKGLLDPPGKA